MRPSRLNVCGSIRSAVPAQLLLDDEHVALALGGRGAAGHEAGESQGNQEEGAPSHSGSLSASATARARQVFQCHGHPRADGWDSDSRSRFAALAGAAPAQATFPGRNGAIAFVHTGSSGDHPPVIETRGLYAAAWTADKGDQPRRLLRVPPDRLRPERGRLHRHDLRRALVLARRPAASCSTPGTSWRSSTPTAPSLTLLPGATADDGSPVFAPDGNRIVFSGANDHGTTDVYVRRLDGDAARAIIHDASDPSMVFAQRDRLCARRERLPRRPQGPPPAPGDLRCLAGLVAGRPAARADSARCRT